MNKINKQTSLDQYIDISRKLGKLASQRDCIRMGMSKGKIDYNWEKLSVLKEAAIQLAPELGQFVTAIPVGLTDIQALRMNILQKQQKANNNKVLEFSNLLQYFDNYTDQIFKGTVKPVKFPKQSKKVKRALTLVLSDLHFGSDILAEETGHSNYGKIEESRRLAAIVKETIQFKEQYRNETELNVLLLGDVIQNQLHDPRDGATIAEQSARAVHLLIQALQQLCNHFPKVNVYCTSGNHGRNTSRHAKRAVNQKWDSWETLIYYSIKKALQSQGNLTFTIPKTPYGFYDVFGKKILYTHGDTVLNPGYPSQSIKIKSLEDQINKINASLRDKEEYTAVVVGHVHTASQTYLSNGTVMITNGALVVPDEYAVSIGILECQTGQMLFESVPGYAVGDTRFIRVGPEHDADKSLDLLVNPWTSFNQ